MINSDINKINPPEPPIHASIQKSNGAFKLLVNGKDYYIRGGGGNTNFKKLGQIGGNSIRTWSATGAKSILDSAYANGLSVTLGLEMGLERQGFDYSNQKMVNEQFERIKKEINQYKNHPALLIWGIGNELELFTHKKEMWNAVQQIAAYLHKNDPNHLTTTMLAGVPQEHISEIIKRCHDLDLISINAFKDLPYIKDKLHKSGWNKPYLITEWGPDGYWESSKTPWNAFIEASSTRKAELCKFRYQNYIASSGSCLGSYVFYWGHKQERTHTVFSLFNEKNMESETIDIMYQLWKGKKRANLAPKVSFIFFEKKKPSANILMEPNQTVEISINAMDPDNDPITYNWEIYFESNEQKSGGDKEKKPPQIEHCFTEKNHSSTKFKVPSIEGAYRIFAYTYDNHNHFSTVNWPILVKSRSREYQKIPVQSK